MATYKNYKQYLQKNFPKLKSPTQKQKAFQAFIQSLNEKGIKSEEFRIQRDKFLKNL
jgi:intergrase/recombinase